MMTDEDLEQLIKETEEQIKQLPDEKAKKLDKDERKKRTLLLAKSQALNRIRDARKAGGFRQEARATLDYTLLVEYGHRNILLYNLMRARASGWSMW